MIYNKSNFFWEWSMTAHWKCKTGDVIKISNYFIVHDITEQYINLKTVEGFFLLWKSLIISNRFVENVESNFKEK